MLIDFTHGCNFSYTYKSSSPKAGPRRHRAIALVVQGINYGFNKLAFLFNFEAAWHIRCLIDRSKIQRQHWKNCDRFFIVHGPQLWIQQANHFIQLSMSKEFPTLFVCFLTEPLCKRSNTPFPPHVLRTQRRHEKVSLDDRRCLVTQSSQTE